MGLATRALAVLLLAAAAARAAPVTEERLARVTYGTADGFYVDAGADDGLREGEAADVERDGAPLGRAEVVAVASGSARLRAVGAAFEVREGDLVRFRAPVPDDGPAPPDGPRRAADEGPFVPLLERRGPAAEPRPRENLGSGRITLRHFLQVDSEGDGGFGRTVFGSQGRVLRLGGTRWALRWNGDISLRTGDAFEGTTLEDVRIDVFELAVRRPLDGGGLLQLGRFVPRGVRAGGLFDGMQAEWRLSDGLRAGAVLGLRPDRADLAPSADEPTWIPYATLEAGERGATWWTGTFGLVGALFDGDLDRLALLVDQHWESGPARLDLSAEIDFDTGAALVRDDPARLSRLFLIGRVRAGPALTLRAGLDHDERVDRAAERAALGSADPRLFDDGFWRAWAGARWRAAARWDLDLELGAVRDPDTGTSPRGRLTVTRRDPLGWTGGTLSLTLYNLEAAWGADGFGGLLTGWLPLDRGRWSLQPRVGFRMVDDAGAELTVTDAGLRVEYAPDRRWRGHLGVGWIGGDAVDAVQVEFGVGLRW